MAFRSIVISLTAAVTTILSAFVGFGVLTLVIQEGYLMELTGLDRTGPIEAFVPPIAFAILFGLSMDYMVFLMSRIREEHVHGLKTEEGAVEAASLQSVASSWRPRSSWGPSSRRSSSRPTASRRSSASCWRSRF